MAGSIDYSAFIDVITRLPGRRAARVLDLLQDLNHELDVPASWIVRRLSGNPHFARWLVRIGTRLAERPFERFFTCFVRGVLVEGQAAREAFRRTHGFYGPAAIGVSGGLEAGVLDGLLVQARDAGARIVTICEPSWDGVVTAARGFDDLVLLAQAGHVDRRCAVRIAEAGNVWPVVRWGEDVESLREAGLLFGVSVTLTRENSDEVADDAFIDSVIESGALFCLVQQYLPCGQDGDPGLMSTPVQRDAVRRCLVRWAGSRPILSGDFMTDGSCLGGCLAANRICHVAGDGAVLPCPHVQFATMNVHDHSLVEVFLSDFFTRIRDMLPCDRNLLRPCMIVDHPAVLRTVVERSGAAASCAGADRLLRDRTLRKQLARYASQWAEIADRAWRGPDYERGHNVVAPLVGRVDVHAAFGERMERASLVGAELLARGLSSAPRGPGAPSMPVPVFAAESV
jgi:hypothetical protein